MAVKKFTRKSTSMKKKSQRAGKIYKKVTSKRKGGLVDTVSTAIVPFGLVAAKRAYAKKNKSKKPMKITKMMKKIKKSLRMKSRRR